MRRNLLLVAEGEVIISVEILHKVLGFLKGNIIYSIVTEELYNLIGRNKFIARSPVESLESYVGAADEWTLVLVELSEALSEVFTLQLPSCKLKKQIS